MNRARWTPQYYQRVLATDPIAHWMGDEKQLAVSYDMVTARSDGARNGAYTGVTLGQPGIGDGRTSGLYDGALDYDAIHTASLAAAFDGDEGTAIIWGRVLAGVWADATFRYAYTLRADANNLILIRKSNAANQLQFRRGTVASGVLNINHASGATTANFCMGFTWSLSAGANGEMRAYVDGVQTGATVANIGAWAGALAANLTFVGALSAAPASVWDGNLAHAALWDRPLTPAEMLSLWVL